MIFLFGFFIWIYMYVKKEVYLRYIFFFIWFKCKIIIKGVVKLNYVCMLLFWIIKWLLFMWDGYLVFYLLKIKDLY